LAGEGVSICVYLSAWRTVVDVVRAFDETSGSLDNATLNRWLVLVNAPWKVDLSMIRDAKRGMEARTRRHLEESFGVASDTRRTSAHL